MSARLVLEFQGWCLMRIPTDPDPTDEPRGASGYTFAFAGEPDLDRIIYLQKPDPDKIPPRKFAPDIGVEVVKAERMDANKGVCPIPALTGATVDLLDDPMLQNRNWTLTLPGYEPIVPFKLQVCGAQSTAITRSAPIDPDNPDKPVWQEPLDQIHVYGAAGIAFEPGTVGRATGIWDYAAAIRERRDKVVEKLKRLKPKPPSAERDMKITRYEGRLYELEYALSHPDDRRTRIKPMIERFAFNMLGKDAVVQGDPAHLGGQLDTKKPWLTAFWIGAWDPDALAGYMKGSLVIPYL